MTLDNLIEGMTVWYVMQEGEHPEARRIAIIRRIVDKSKGIVHLMVIPEPGDIDPDQLIFRKDNVHYSQSKEYFTWHFIGK